MGGAPDIGGPSDGEDLQTHPIGDSVSDSRSVSAVPTKIDHVNNLPTLIFKSSLSSHALRQAFPVWTSMETSHPFVLVLVLILGTSHHQADACHLASVYLGFRSIWNTHFCLRLQPHLYPSLVETSLGRDVRPNSDISQRMSSPTPPSKTRNYC